MTARITHRVAGVIGSRVDVGGNEGMVTDWNPEDRRASLSVCFPPKAELITVEIVKKETSDE